MDTLARRVKYLIYSEGLSVSAAAKKCGIPQPRLNDIVQGKTLNPRSQTLAKIAKGFNARGGWLLTSTGPIWDTHKPNAGEGRMRPTEPATEILGGTVLIPRYNVEASAGGGTLVADEQIIEHIPISEAWLRSTVGAQPQNTVIISTVGDSMEPTLHPGDLLLIDRSINEIRESAVYAILIDGALMVKRVQKGPRGSLIIKSDNQAYDAMTFTGDDAKEISVAGRLVGAWRRF